MLSWYLAANMAKLTERFRTDTSLEGLLPGVRVVATLITAGVDLTKLMLPEPSSAPPSAKPAKDFEPA